ncbi:MAG TPA: hypothetical protein VGI65_02845 [Steroidobacteraceae bacterium]|jgi:hypothetical protein
MRTVWAAVGIAMAFALPGWAGGADVDGPQPAVWKEQHLTFFYVGRTARYSCQGLRDKVRLLLMELGARHDLKVSVQSCDESAPRMAGSSLGPTLGIVFSSPAMSDAGAKPASGNSSVDARFMPFTLTSDVFRNIGLGDCELIEEFTRQILPKMTTRDVRREIACIPNQMTGSRFFVSGQILKPTASSP